MSTQKAGRCYVVRAYLESKGINGYVSTLPKNISDACRICNRIAGARLFMNVNDAEIAISILNNKKNAKNKYSYYISKAFYKTSHSGNLLATSLTKPDRFDFINKI